MEIKEEALERVLKMRKQWQEGDTKRDKGLTTPPEVQRFDDISYGPYGKWNLLDVYRPKEAKGPLPVIVSFHGGGFFYGTKEVYQFYCMNLAKRGFVVVNFNYRLAPEWAYPTPLEDAARVFGWLRQEAETYGMDLNNIFLVGDSAGGQLASQYALMCSNPQYAATFSFPVPPASVRAVGLNCGLYTLDDAFMQDPGPMELYFGADILERCPEQLPMGPYITKDYPPAFVMSCYGDFLQSMAQPMADFLKAKGVETKLEIYGTEKAPLYHVFHVNQRQAEAHICNDAQCEFFRQHLAPN